MVDAATKHRWLELSSEWLLLLEGLSIHFLNPVLMVIMWVVAMPQHTGLLFTGLLFIGLLLTGLLFTGLWFLVFLFLRVEGGGDVVEGGSGGVLVLVEGAGLADGFEQFVGRAGEEGLPDVLQVAH